MSSASLDTHYIEEAMTDNTGRAASHPCYHKTMEVSIDTIQRPLVAPRVDGPGGKVVYTGLDPVWVPSNRIWLGPLSGWDVKSRTPGAYAPRWSVPAGFVLNEDSLKNDVLERARGLKADVALNIIESSQIWPSIRSLATSLPQMARNWKSIRKVIRTASGSYLAWKFGISPILDDAVSIVKYADRLKRDLRRYNERQKQRVSRTAILPFKFDDTPSTDGVYNGITWGQRTFVGTALQAPTVRYVLVVEPRAADECLKALDFVTSRFSSSPASLAWELVPFSFVLDWFVDIRGALRAIDNLVGGTPYKIVSFTRSLSYEVYALATHTYRHTCSGAILSRHDVGSVRYKHYERIPVSDSTKLALWKPRFGKNQAAITAALIAQQVTTAGASRLAKRTIRSANRSLDPVLTPVAKAIGLLD